ncbi:MAG: hypothetical protein SFX73_14065 [Kofleriaceae bacterium]|nr:hypothetical protein [Kofleriaceae bacterium]
MAKAIRKRAGADGKVLLDWIWEVFLDPDDKYFFHQKQWAAEILLARGWGRPITTIELDAAITTPDAPPPRTILDVAALDQKQRETLRTALALVRGERPPPLPAPVIDVATDDEVPE